MSSDLTLKQRKFAHKYLETGNATEAAMNAYKPKNRNTAHSIGSENLRKPAIRVYLDEKARDATSMVYKLSQRAKSETVRLNASKDILDRAGYFVDKTLKINQKPSSSFLISLRSKTDEELEEIILGRPRTYQ